jgi:hypothetical protein
MTEAEATEALTNIAMTCATYFSVYISLSFAYFTVAYVIGSTITRFQLILISFVYSVAQLLVGMTFVIWTLAFEKLHAREQTILSDIWALQHMTWSETAVMLILSIFLASVYFMYDIRKRGTS